MTSVTYAAMIADSQRVYAEVIKLAYTFGARGAPQARKALRSASKYGLGDRAYIVRDQMLYGWSGTVGHYTVEPRRGASAPVAAAARVAASRARSGVRTIGIPSRPEEAAAIERLAQRLGVSRTQAVHRAVAEALAQSSSGD